MASMAAQDESVYEYIKSLRITKFLELMSEGKLL